MSDNLRADIAAAILRAYHANDGQPWVSVAADAIVVMVRADLAAANALLRDAHDELDNHGWGDFHYGATPQERGIVDMMNRIRGFLDEPQLPTERWEPDHRARVGGEPLRCDNCGKTMAEHGPLANCRTRVGDDK